MKKLATFSIVALLAVGLALPAAAQIDFEGQVTGRFQDVEGEEDPDWDDVDQEMGFNDALLNLQVYGDVAAGVDAFAEVQAKGASDTVDIYEAYLTHSELVPMTDLKVGQFELNFGNQRQRGSNNADVQANNLIGNAVVDPTAVQTGLELSGQYMGAAWSLAATNGTEGADFDDDRDMALTAKVWGELMPGLSAAASYHTVDHDTDAESNFGLSDYASEGYYLDGDLAPGDSANEVDAWQLDLTYDLAEVGQPAELYANYGVIETDDGDEFEREYFTVEGRYDLTPASHLALRWSEVNLEPDDDDDGDVERLQIGVGHELSPNTLAKLEYVDQDVDDDAGEYADKFDGIVGELSVSF